MISARALDAAIERGVLSSDQATRLRAIEAECTPDAPPEPIDDESLRFVTGFADIFVTIGVVLFLGALFLLMNTGTGSTLAYAGVAISAWLLAEFFALKRRMALPSIVLLVAFVGAVFVLAAQIFASLLPTASPVAGQSILGIVPLEFLPLGLAAPRHSRLGRPALRPLPRADHHCRRRCRALHSHRVDGGRHSALDQRDDDQHRPLHLRSGGVRAGDVLRHVRPAAPDAAHRHRFLAAPARRAADRPPAHPRLPARTRRSPHHQRGAGHPLGLRRARHPRRDHRRRAILVSGLVYAGFALSALIRAAGFTAPAYSLPAVALALGAFILLLSAGWQPLRRAILRRLPPPLATRLPHPILTSGP